jgi:Asp-tRNA(Asn)/Glu-tRNA(Gln) amidotransferase A subunit family amidase
MSELYKLSAVDTLRAFGDRSVSPSEYLEAILERIDVAQPVVNALGDRYVEEARTAARAAEKRYARGDARPLEGLPVAIKDEAAIAGKRATNGSLLMQDNVADRDDPIVERLRAAGAIFHARTLTPEFEITFWTASRMWGITRNPWNVAFDSGGSSGGSAAALAAGMTPLATGSDIGGSIRVPASCCGVVGYKATWGRMPAPPPVGLDAWYHVGPLGRTVGDVALAADVMMGPHRLAHAAIRPPLRIGPPTADVRDLRIAVSEDLGDWPVVPSVRAGIRAVADALRDAGATVEETDLRIERSLLRIASDAHYAAAFGAIAETLIAGHEELVNPYTTRWLGTLQQARGFADGLEAEGQIQERLGALFETYDALICPAIGVPALEAGVDYTDVPLVVEGQPYDAMREVCPTEIFNVASRCPVLCVPAGRDDATGVPVGAQIVGRTYEDHTVFRIGAAVEAALPWPHVAEL